MTESLHGWITSVSWLRWLFVTKDGEVVIAQSPNAPILIALAADVLAYLAHGTVQAVSNRVAQVAFVAWSVMEIGWGVNPFRRLLGAAVLALVGFGVYRGLA